MNGETLLWLSAGVVVLWVIAARACAGGHKGGVDSQAEATDLDDSGGCGGDGGD
ncbi:hypothetical protein [Marinovum sp.]|uniref:hypothetical protein n=1 Tax=Marinovum sp. TaxID=2024839 RepID=UPI003A9578DB